MRKKLLLTITLSVAATSLLVIMSGESRLLFTNWTVNTSAAASLAMAAVVAFRQGAGGLYGKALVALAAGIALWLAAELLWTYYELGLGIETPFPSLADAFWLAGYAPLAYYLFKIYGFFGRGKPVVAAFLSGLYAVFVAYLVMLIVPGADEDPVALAVSIAYPIVDGALVIPSLLVLSNLKKGKFTSTPWMLMSSALLMVVMADSGFAYYTATNLEGQIWVWDLLFNASYVTMAATLFWHNRFFIFDKKKTTQMWQKENR